MAKVKRKKAVVKKATKKAAAKNAVAKKIYKVAAIKPPVNVAFRGDAKQTSYLVRAGRTGAATAISASKALGLPIVYMENGVVVREMPNGVKEIVVHAMKDGLKKSDISFKKGMIFHAKK